VSEYFSTIVVKYVVSLTLGPTTGDNSAVRIIDDRYCIVVDDDDNDDDDDDET